MSFCAKTRVLAILAVWLSFALTFGGERNYTDDPVISGQADNTNITAKGISVVKFLAEDGRFEIEKARQSGYQGPLDVSDYNVSFDPITNEPVIKPADPESNSVDISGGGIFAPLYVDGVVTSLALYNGDLIVGGNFSTIWAIPANCIASWDGTSWSALGSGMNDSVTALTVYDNKLIAGGYFTTAGGIAAIFIASWDGSSWSSLASGMNDAVRALTVYDNKLVAGGYFTTAGGVAASRIASWDGSSWSPLASGMNANVSAVVVWDNKLIAGGDFTTAGGVGASRIASWDGSSWSPLGSGMSSRVMALIVYDNMLIAGGYFSTAGGVTVNYIASWDGSSWSSLGSGMSGGSYLRVNCLTVYDNNLIAGGSFTAAGGTTVNFIASWDGSSWSSLGSGMNSRVVALTVYDNKLIAGGWFSLAGGIVAARIAAWNGSYWSKFGFVQPDIDTINVEVDYMVSDDHSHELLPDEVAAVEDMFACQGIVINIEISDAIPHVDILEADNGTIFNNMTPNTGFGWIKENYSDHLGESGWHYCIMAHQYDFAGSYNSSGLAEYLGDDFLVSLGPWWTLDEIGTPFHRAATFAHELGHNLGLLHSGDQDESAVSAFKPNYVSIMSYRYTLPGIRQGMMCAALSDSCNPFRNLDYSHGMLASLDETALDETIGIGYGPVDWNCNGVIDLSPVAYDLASFPCQNNGSYQTITDYDDWSNIIDVTYTRNREALKNPKVISCMTFEEYNQLRGANPELCGDLPFDPEPCAYPYSDADGDGIGDNCDNCPGTAYNDEDGDGICGDVDNCPYTFNPGQVDINGNGVGDVCECTTPNRVYTGEVAYDWFGWRANNAGDFNGDGYDDMIVGAPTNDFAANNAGSAYIYCGKTGALLHFLCGEAESDIFGISVDGAGDVNTDGYADVIVGAHRSDGAGANSGRAYVFFGNSGSNPDTISASDADMIFDGSASNDFFGYGVAGIGDADGVPGPDLLIGAPQLNVGEGKAFIFSGQTGLEVRSFSGETLYDAFGYAVAPAGDFDNDGIEDIIIGAPTYDNESEANAGRVYIYSGLSGNLLVTITGTSNNDWLGCDVSAAGNTNGDDYGDVIIGAYFSDSQDAQAGHAYVFNGFSGPFPAALTTDLANMVFAGKVDQSYLGYSVSYTRDMNGDAIDELVVGEPVGDGGLSGLCGLVHIYSGSDGTELYTVTSETKNDWFGRWVCGTEGSNSVNSIDLIVGAYYSDSGGTDAGRTYVFYFGDEDSDGILDNCDNCLGIANADQDDMNLNGVGDACEFICGDANNDGTVNILDITFLISFLYKDGPAPESDWASDPNGDGTVNILDITYLISFLYKDGPEPVCP